MVYSIKMKKAQQLATLWGPVIVCGGLIFYLSSIPKLRAAENPFWDEVIRSTLHFLIYAILFVFLFRAINALRRKKNYFWAIAIAFLYSISDEYHQSLVPTRTFQLRDLVVNLLGILAGSLLIWKFLPTAPEKLKSWAKRFQLI